MTALVIGSSGGIGTTTVKLLIERGMSVVGADVNEATVRSPRYEHVQADAADAQGAAKILDVAREYECRHIINVAGGAARGEVVQDEETPPSLEYFTQTMASNFYTSVTAIRVATSIIEEKPDSPDVSVTLCSSINSIGRYGYPIYSASKAAVESLVHTQARPLGEVSIRVNAVRLGTVMTEASVRLHGGTDSNHYGPLQAATALSRFVSVVEASSALINVAVDLSGVTGTVITVDAGQSIPGYSERRVV